MADSTLRARKQPKTLNESSTSPASRGPKGAGDTHAQILQHQSVHNARAADEIGYQRAAGRPVHGPSAAERERDNNEMPESQQARCQQQRYSCIHAESKRLPGYDERAATNSIGQKTAKATDEQ